MSSQSKYSFVLIYFIILVIFTVLIVTFASFYYLEICCCLEILRLSEFPTTIKAVRHFLKILFILYFSIREWSESICYMWMMSAWATKNSATPFRGYERIRIILWAHGKNSKICQFLNQKCGQLFYPSC